MTIPPPTLPVTMCVDVATMKALQLAVGASSHDPADILQRVREILENVYRNTKGTLSIVPLSDADIDSTIAMLMGKASVKR